MKEINTERIKLRRFTIDDLENMVTLESDPDIVKFTRIRKPLDRETSKSRLEALVARTPSLEPLGVWAIEDLKSTEFIGWIMLQKTTEPYPELGFMIAKNKWGKGYATEAGKALVAYGLKTLNLPAISAVTDLNNSLSIKTLSKIGFQQIGADSESLFFEINC